MPTPHQVSLRKYVTQRQKHQHMTASEPNHNPRGAPSSMSGSPAPGFGDSSGYTSVTPIYKPTKDLYPVPIIKTTSVPSENPTKYPSCVPNEFPSSNPSNILIEYPTGYPTGSPRTIPTENTSSNPRPHPRSDPDSLKRGSQEAQVSLKLNLIMFIFLYHITFVLKPKIHRNTPMSQSENILHRGT